MPVEALISLKCGKRGTRMKKIRLIDRLLIDSLLTKRPKDMHKGDCGRVLIVAGSVGMAGAAVLSARGALRSGAGLVRISAPLEIFPILQNSVTEATCITRELTAEILSDCQAIVAGPGLGRSSENRRLLDVILNSACPVIVLDADALNTIADEDLFESLRQAEGRLIITPHPGEAVRLLGCSRDDVKNDRPETARMLAEKTRAVAVLKGAGTIIASPEGEMRINTTGNPGMATGGSGDVLSGIIASLAGQGLSCFDAATAGVYVHGMAGDLAAEAFGEPGMTAGDLPGMTALALKTLLAAKER